MIQASRITNPNVAGVFDGHPEHVRQNMIRVRQLILDTASETDGVNDLDETVKWGRTQLPHQRR